MSLYDKLNLLKDNIRNLGNLAVAYSGGVDSTFLLAVAHQVLGDKAAGITARSPLNPKREMDESIKLAGELGVRHIIFDVGELKPEIAANPKDRCYICKTFVLSEIRRIAGEEGFTWIAEGSNTDDLNDYRPGMRAVEEQKVLSPLREAGLSKEEIRILSRNMELPTWNKPSFACLASRIPYGDEITNEKLSMVESAERFLLDLGFKQFRVRLHGRLARIELLPEDIHKAVEPVLSEQIQNEFRKTGFLYVALDLAGYRTGSMNDAIK